MLMMSEEGHHHKGQRNTNTHEYKNMHGHFNTLSQFMCSHSFMQYLVAVKQRCRVTSQLHVLSVLYLRTECCVQWLIILIWNVSESCTQPHHLNLVTE